MEARERFINDHGRFLPEDLCPYIPDLPLMYVLDQEGSEGAVNLEASVVAEVTLRNDQYITTYRHFLWFLGEKKPGHRRW